jgi:hypothetical protein
MEEGHGVSPKKKIQRIPAVVPKIRKERTADTKKPGIPNNREYRYLFFIGPLRRFLQDGFYCNAPM